MVFVNQSRVVRSLVFAKNHGPEKTVKKSGKIHAQKKF